MIGVLLTVALLQLVVAALLVCGFLLARLLR